jgi:hypothetical protein
MGMKISLKEFKEKFSEGLLEIYWKQWSALGVASHVEPETNWFIDLEALVLSTLVLGLKDARLLNASIEWLIKNGEWLSLQRVKRIAKVFTRSSSELSPQFGPLLDSAAFGLLGEILRKEGQKGWSVERISSQRTEKTEYEAFFRNFQKRGIVTEPVLQRPSLLQVRLRLFFGVDAKAEVFVYLLTHDVGNSNSVAKETFLNQRNVYEILDRWHKVGLLTKIKGAKIGIFTLEKKKEWINALGLRGIPVYLNWVNAFHLFNRVLRALSLQPWSEDEYMLSSFFRDILEEAKGLGRSLGISFPEPAQYPGAVYFSPFALKVLEAIERLGIER